MPAAVNLRIRPGAPYEHVIAFTGTVTLPATLTAAVVSKTGRHVLDLAVSVDVTDKIVTVTADPAADLRPGLVEWAAADTSEDVWLAGSVSIDSRWTGQESSSVPPDTTVAVTQQVLTIEGGTIGGGGPPTGPAGGVLSGTYPNPGFAVDMATQAELDSHATSEATARGLAISTAVAAHEVASDPHPQYQTQSEGDARYFRPTTGTTLTDADIPGAIARDSEVSAAVATEATDRATAVTAEASARATADALLIPLAQRAAANGVATLDGAGLIPTAQLPALAITDTFPVASQAAMLALTAEVGDVAIRSDLNKSFILRASPASTLGNWNELLTPTDAVLSVDGLTGAVSLPTDAAAGTGSKRTLGTGATQAAAGNDARLSDQRTPSDASVTPAKFAASAIDPSAATAGARTLGTSATQAAAGNDPRLSDARTPTAHAASHGSGGSDAVTLAESQVTGLTTDLAAKVALAGSTSTGEQVAPSFNASGKTGATAFPLILAGSTSSGAPSSGAHLKGELAGDATGALWYCTAAGTPGTWVQIGGGGSADKLGLTATAVKTANYTAAAGDLVLVDTSTANVTVTLPSAPSDGSVVAVVYAVQGLFAAAYQRGGTDHFDTTTGPTSVSMDWAGHAALLQYKSGVWYRLADNVPWSRIVATFSPITTSKGTIPVGNGTTQDSLPVSTDGLFISADSTQSRGVKYRSPFYQRKTGVSEYFAPDDGVTTGTSALTLNRVYFIPFPVHYAYTVDRLALSVTTAGSAGAIVRMAIFTSSNGRPNTLVVEPAATIDSSTTGDKELTLSQALTPGLYWLAVVAQSSTCTVRGIAPDFMAMVGSTALSDQTTGTTTLCWIQAGVTGAFSTINPATPTPQALSNQPRPIVRAA